MTNLDYYITTTIPYVNGRPHIGHALEFVQADALARSLKLLGNRVTFQTGTDDNAIKNVRSAEEAGVSPKEFVDQNAAKFRKLCDDCCIDYDQFVRTSGESHKKGVQKFWSALKPEDLYRKSYSGLYCYGCEDFYKEENLVDGLCPDHQKAPEPIDEENFFFRLSHYEDQLIDLIEADKLKIEPQSRKNEVLSFIKQDLTDISISRSKLRTSGWGVPVPGQTD
ncbi:MAG: class I tRNA ligase family protein [Bdellovibrionales bacterium]|nr:class I tRNA ligase family protein [Bdellovibrionales bacterium]